MNAPLILVVEDDEKNRKLTRDILVFKGYRVAVATSGEEALAILAQAPADLVLMDIQLPGISGVVATTRIRADHSFDAMPVVAFTASVMPSETGSLQDVGFDGLITKPFALRPFIDMIERVLKTGRGAGK